ncbi:MAG TPA: GAF domain-containing protein [Thermoanaerobaculia bacterium]
MSSTLDLATRLSVIVEAQQQILAHVTDPAELMNVAVRQTQRITDGDGAAIEEVEGGELVYRAVSGRAVAGPSLRLPIDNSLSGAALHRVRSLRCDDVETDKRVDAEACRKLGIRSMIVAPLMHGDAPSGVLQTFSEQPKFFDDLDSYSVELLAGMISVALMLAAEFRRRQASEERYRLLFEKNVAGVFRTTRDGRILDFNDAFAAYLGYDSRDELLAQQSWDLYPQRSDREQLLSRLLREQAITNLALHLKKKDGSDVHGIMNVGIIPGDTGDELQLLGTFVPG